MPHLAESPSFNPSFGFAIIGTARLADVQRTSVEFQSLVRVLPSSARRSICRQHDQSVFQSLVRVCHHRHRRHSAATLAASTLVSIPRSGYAIIGTPATTRHAIRQLQVSIPRSGYAIIGTMVQPLQTASIRDVSIPRSGYAIIGTVASGSAVHAQLKFQSLVRVLPSSARQSAGAVDARCSVSIPRSGYAIIGTIADRSGCDAGWFQSLVRVLPSSARSTRRRMQQS